jgi:CheY-like chemotaxis protein
LDVRMPVMDGLEAARQIKAHFAASAQCPKVVALTASALPGDREKSLEAGMDEFLSKPILPAEIVACFNRLFPEPAATRPAAPARIDSLLPPLLDCAHLDALMAGLPRHDALDMRRAMFGGVLDDYRETRGSLAAAAASQDPVMLGEAAHGLKGCFANVGWARASAHCADILAQARSGTFGNWEGLLPALDAVVAASTSAMEAHLHAASSAPV